MFCPQCGNTSAVLGAACAGCGSMVSVLVANPPPQGKVESISAASSNDVKFYAAAIGSSAGHDYYLKRFQLYDAQGGAQAGWHWPAFLATFWWMLYRKMWRSALILFFAPSAVVLLAVTAMSLLGQTVGGLLGGLVFLLYLGWIFIWIPAHATGMYYRHCRARIAESKKASDNEEKQLRMLAAKGGTSGLIVVLLMIFAVVPSIGMLAAIVIPQYAEYTARSEMKAVQGYSSAAKEAIANHYYATHRIPSSLEEAGFIQMHPPMVGQVSVGRGGVLTVALAGQPLAGKTLVYVPALNDQQRIVWECRGEEIAVRLLPKDCQPAR